MTIFEIKKIVFQITTAIKSILPCSIKFKDIFELIKEKFIMFNDIKFFFWFQHACLSFTMYLICLRVFLYQNASKQLVRSPNEETFILSERQDY